ncbi:MAG TPA: fasciclin domain-containing protein, partial [Silvibacterium sp.]|nr:fasciclin domain-containing protein [Silvibacterium sp.]
SSSWTDALAYAQKDPMVGGAAMYPTKNIIENAVHSKDHTTLVAAVKAAGLVNTLEGPRPFTVFAPTNEAFAKLPAGTVDTLLKPESKETLTKILTYHVVPGRVTASDLNKMIKDGGGKAELKTLKAEPSPPASAAERWCSLTRTAGCPPLRSPTYTNRTA